ncbi:hypothetical protein CBR_g31563 [Chara braunii]|uniref:1,4-alpha-glucan branching enzyme n=1 Tax=Chara braunii TaxID=69332 RepID=A0A388LFG9_CHABU|nr:hypothetical protein CBR_g31563 [Chara braunii]|eukprot:GBG81007.1 hypothetical protein CBR_g31563 [Chara braunii]
MYSQLCTPGLGAILDGQGGCVFRVWAPNAEAAFIALHDEASSVDGQEGTVKMIAMEKQGAFWAQRVRNVRAGDKYHYVFRHQGVDYHRRDARARHTDFNSDACIITDPTYEWYPFQTPAFEEMIIYQLHVGAFTGRDGAGSFMEAEGKLDHIKGMGFNTIQLMPVHEFSGEWGYNPRLLCAIHQKYGTPEQLRHFVNECHIRGIAVIFEVVLNHMATNLNSLWAYDGLNTEDDGGLYFDRAFDTGSSRGFAYEEREVREMISDAVRMFLSEYKADGLRIHAVHNTPREVLEDMTSTMHEEFPGKILISDVTPENPKIVSRTGFDSTVIHSTYFDMRKHMRGDLDGRKLEKAIGLHYGFTKPTQCIKHFLGAHDHIGDRNDGMFDAAIDGFHRYAVDLFGGRAKWEANAAARAWYMVMTMSAGIPLLFMGTEFSQDGWWGVQPDECVNWEKAEDDTGKTMMKLVKAANEFRRESPAVLHGTVDVVHYDENHGIIGFWRKSEKEWLFVVANLSSYQWSEEEYEVRVGNCGTGHKFIEVFNSQDAQYGGWEGSGNAGKKLKGNGRRISINLPQWSVLIFEPTD